MVFGCACLVLLVSGVGRTLSLEDEIVFSANLDDSDYEIYRMALGRGVTVQLTHNKVNDLQPDWSPDGQQIVFVNDASAANRVYIMNADGSNTHRLSNQANGGNLSPMWSPDGQFIAYISSARAGATPELTLFDLKTDTNRRLTHNSIRALMPYWSPDGRQIAFVTESPNRLHYDIVSITVKSGVVQLLTATDRDEINPAWSPDGHSIVYVGNFTDGIYLLDIVSNQSTLLYTLKSISYINGWLADSHRILYTALSRDGNQYISTLNVADCLNPSDSCIPQVLASIRGNYINPHPRWRPHQP